jgi:hypothetical protein
VNVAKRESRYLSRLIGFEAKDYLMLGVNGTGIWSLGRFPVSGKLEPADLVREFFCLGEKEDLDPADMMLGSVGVGNFLAYASCQFKKLPLFYFVRRLDYRNMLFLFPVRSLERVLEFSHFSVPRFMLERFNLHHLFPLG